MARWMNLVGLVILVTLCCPSWARAQALGPKYVFRNGITTGHSDIGFVCWYRLDSNLNVTAAPMPTDTLRVFASPGWTVTLFENITTPIFFFLPRPGHAISQVVGPGARYVDFYFSSSRSGFIANPYDITLTAPDGTQTVLPIREGVGFGVLPQTPVVAGNDADRRAVARRGDVGPNSLSTTVEMAPTEVLDDSATNLVAGTPTQAAFVVRGQVDFEYRLRIHPAVPPGGAFADIEVRGWVTSDLPGWSPWLLLPSPRVVRIDAQPGTPPEKLPAADGPTIEWPIAGQEAFYEFTIGQSYTETIHMVLTASVAGNSFAGVRSLFHGHAKPTFFLSPYCPF